MIQQKEKVNIGLVGYGKYGETMLLPALKAHSDVVNVAGVVETNPDARKRAEGACLPTTENVTDFLDKNPNLDYLYVAITPTSLLHFLDTLAEYLMAHDRKITVCLEKPLGYDFNDALELYTLLTEKVFSLATVFNRFSYPTFKQGLELLTQGSIGTLQKINDVMIISGPPPFLDGWVQQSDKNKDRGIALLNGYHSNSLVPLLLGLPHQVQANIQNKNSYPGTQVDDFYHGEMKTKKKTATILNMWGSHDLVKLSTQLDGDRGGLLIEQWGKVGVFTQNETRWQTPSSDPTLRVGGDNGKEGSFIREHAIQHDAGIWGFHSAIINFLLKKCALPHHVEHSSSLAILTMLLIEMAYESNKRNARPVCVDEVLDGRLPTVSEVAQRVKLPGNY